jgi:hypothetical protein
MLENYRRAGPLRRIPRTRWAYQEPTYRQAAPALIEAALAQAQGMPTGNWFVLCASREVTARRPLGRTVADRELVAWRPTTGALVVGPGACPHLGAPLAQARIEAGRLVCRWHGMPLGPGRCAGWAPLPSYDDGVLAWVRLDEAGGEAPTETPVIPVRPDAEGSIDAVASMTGTCEPDDVIANRLDPWHGAWFHPYSFARLRVAQTPGEDDPRFLVEVTFRVTGRLGVPVTAEFACADARTVLMRITDGEGTGSVVETHATPLGHGPDGKPRTAVIEATVAFSERPGFALARLGAPALRPLIRRTAARLWRDDLAYAERRYALRHHD